MGMPQIPDGKTRPNFEQTIIDLLESVALEEMALAHIINAEGEKMQEVTKLLSCHQIRFSDVELACKSMREMMDKVIMKEWLLMNKLGTVIEVNEIKHSSKKEQPECHTMENQPSYSGNNGCCSCSHQGEHLGREQTNGHGAFIGGSIDIYYDGKKANEVVQRENYSGRKQSNRAIDKQSIAPTTSRSEASGRETPKVPDTNSPLNHYQPLNKGNNSDYFKPVEYAQMTQPDQQNGVRERRSNHESNNGYFFGQSRNNQGNEIGRPGIYRGLTKPLR